MKMILLNLYKIEGGTKWSYDFDMGITKENYENQRLFRPFCTSRGDWQLTIIGNLILIVSYNANV